MITFLLGLSVAFGQNSCQVALSTYEIFLPSTYTVSMALVSDFPSSGYFELVFPSYFKSLPTPVCTMQLPSLTSTCSVSNLSIFLSISSALNLGASVVFTLGGLENPSPALQMIFTCNTRNPDLSIIDSYSGTVVYTARQLSYVNISTGSGVSGVVDQWTFVMNFDYEVDNGGYVTVFFPKWNSNLNPNVLESFITSNSNCDLTCSVNGDLVTVSIGNSVSGLWTVTIKNLRNPPSTQPVSGFVVRVYSSTGELENSIGLVLQVVSQYGGQLTSPSILPSLTKVNTKSLYTFSFLTSNPVPATSTITITFPSSIILQISQILPTFGFDYTTLTYTSTSSQISITNPIVSYKEENCYFEFSIDSCINPSSTTPIYASVSIYSLSYISDTSGLFVIVSTAGNVMVNSISLSNSGINQSTVYAFSFYSEEKVLKGSCIRVEYPNDVLASDISACSSISEGISSSSLCSSLSNILYITNAFSEDFTSGNMKFSISGVTNPSTTKPTGAFIIGVYTDSTFLYKISENRTFFITATPGTLGATVVPESYITGEVTSYIFSLTISNKILTGGYLLVVVPSLFQISSSSCSFLSGFSSATSCVFSTSSFTIINAFDSDFTGTLKFQLNQITNPPSTKPTSTFKVYSYSDIYLIDQLTTGLIITMTQLHKLTIASVTSDSLIVGANTYFTFTIYPFNAIPSGGNILIQPSSDIIFTSQITCTSTGLTSCTCNIISGNLKATVSSTSTFFTIKAGLIQNPLSTKPASFLATTSDGVYNIDSSAIDFQVSTAASFKTFTITASSLYINTVAEYTLAYTVANSIPAAGYIEIKSDFFTSSAQCSLNSLQIPCTYASSILTLQGTFPTSGSILLSSLINPLTSGTYSVSITSKTKENYLIDFSSTNIVISCQSPCLTCTSSASACLSCIPTSTKPYYWNSQCNSNCETGYYSESYNCFICSSECKTCIEQATKCTACIEGYLYLNTCVSSCPDGFYLLGSQCVECVLPCKDCESANTCVSCVSPYNLYNQTCILSCPTDFYIAQDNICQACTDCYTCINTPSTCTSCLDSQYLYSSSCYTQCPQSTYTNLNFCLPCSNNCLTCINSSSYCTSCNSALKLFENTCISICASGFYYSNGNCIQCNSTCMTCTEKSCLTCKVELFLQEGTCIEQCDIGFYPENLICYMCPSTCKDCISISQCTNCVDDMYFYQGGCFENCLSGTFEYEGVCISCSDCPLCDSVQGCLYCNEGFFFNFTCIGTCPDGFVDVVNVCVACNNCSKCSLQPYNCTECLDELVLFESTCLSTCPEGYGLIENECVLNTTGLCSPGCTSILLNNAYCDQLCNTASCSFDSNNCANTENDTFASSLDVKENPFILSSFGVLSASSCAAVSLLSSSIFINTALPAVGTFESISWFSLFVALSKAENFRGRTLNDTDSNIKVLTGVIMTIWLIHFMINIGFCVVYWKHIRSQDGLHKAWTSEHKWGISLLLLAMGLFSYRAVLLLISNFPGIKVFHGRFEQENFLKKPLKFTELIHLFTSTFPILSTSAYILFAFSQGSFVYIMALDCICITGISVILSFFFIFFSGTQKKTSKKYQPNEDFNVTVEVTEITHVQAPKVEEERPVSDYDSQGPTDRDIPSSEEPALSTHAYLAFKKKIYKKPMRKKNFSFGLMNLCSTIDEDLIDFNNFTVDCTDLLKLRVFLKGSNEQITILKDFSPITVLDDDGQVLDLDIVLSDYEILNVNKEDPHIGEFQHRIYKTKLKLFRNFDGAKIVNLEEDFEVPDKSGAETFRNQTMEKPIFDCDYSEIIQANDSFISVKSLKNGLSLGSSKVLMRSGSPPKPILSKTIQPNPGLAEISLESYRSN